jgi:hypothetical protein
VRKLDAISSTDRVGLIDFLGQTARPAPSEVLWYDFGSDPSTRRGFPIDHLLLVKLQGKEDEKAYSQKIHELLDLTEQQHLSILVLPCLGQMTHPVELVQQLSCHDSFLEVFQGLHVGESPAEIYFSFYKQWDDKTIEEEASSLDSAWKLALANEQKISGVLPIIYHADLRLMLLFLFFCLLICSFQIDLTFRTSFIICVSFVPAALELQDKLAPLLLDVVESSPTWAVKSCLLALLSGGYLFFSRIDIKQIFNPHDSNA